jgi:hypothetical protein
MSEWVCDTCKSINRAAARKCYSCGLAQGAAPVIAPMPAAAVPGPMAGMPFAMGAEGGSMPLAVGADGGSMSLIGEVAMPPAPSGTAAGPMDLIGGLVGGAVTAVLASAVWYGVVSVSQFQVGLVAIAVGWLVAQGVVYGAQRRFSVFLIPISVILTLLALAVSEYLIVAHFVSQEIGAPVELFQPPAFVIEVVTASLQSDPLTLVFWAIALFQAFVIPTRVARPSGA